MNRKVTNIIRFFIDECLPPIIRDSKIFMLPLFYFWYKGKNYYTPLNLKKNIWQMSEQQIADVYNKLDCRATDRATDLSIGCIKKINSYIPNTNLNILDVGCGRGYFVKQLREINSLNQISACDVFNNLEINGVSYKQVNLNNLPYNDKEFDFVCCSHVLEHVTDINKAIQELKRVCKKTLIICIPKQRYYYYTLDMHIHFYPYKEKLVYDIGLKSYEIFEIDGDWVYIGYI